MWATGTAGARGLVAAPDSHAYDLGLARGIVPWRDGRSILDVREQDPGILQGELWAMLACEGAGKELAYADTLMTNGWSLPGKPKPPPSPQRSWQHALVTLAGDGRVDRRRLLDETLIACPPRPHHQAHLQRQVQLDY